ncbi:hypothetical protein [Stigmatella erecta]|uniref:Uncharacterized protein n=1 Tax=Stigmatella erecta TaxID=83460 RepID=A0A1I0JDV8_9BACT|nr:hypothetical protein [Stigmatella erecta]SEU08129.1 hypothetical protein SAMN05443639_107176 [Stigmatella erecta]
MGRLKGFSSKPSFSPPPTRSPQGPAPKLQRTSDGAKVPQQPTLATNTPPRVQVRLDERQKFHQQTLDSPNTRQQHKNDYFDMDAAQFATLKNGGKRTGSNKAWDPATGKNYAYDKQSGQFFEFDKTKPGNKGAPVNPQQNAALKQSLSDGTLVDRSRQDRNRTDEPVRPGDVGPYEKNLRVRPNDPSSELKHVSGTKADWNTNRDHVPSGESLNKRNRLPGQAPDAKTDAYKEGVTVAIPDDRAHKAHSLTYGSRQTYKDADPAGNRTTTRVDHDANHPASAFHRDSHHLLNTTQNQNLFNPGKDATPHQTPLDMAQPDSRLGLIGSYRYAGSVNSKINQNIGPGRGYDPSAPAESFTPASTAPGGKRKYDKIDVTYQNVPNQTQGQVISNSLRDRLINEGFAQDVPTL